MTTPIAVMPTISRTPTGTDPRAAHARAEQALLSHRLSAPARSANIARNARAELDRHRRWGPARDALWQVLDRLLTEATRVAILGAGNADTIPLDRIAARVREITLIDVDETAIRAARRRQPRWQRRCIVAIEHDIIDGAADSIAAAAASGEVPFTPVLPEAPLPGAPYDLVIGDLLYSQLLYPALVDLAVPAARTTGFVARYAPMLTRSVVARLTVSAPTGLVLHIHDPVAWWPGHAQPVTLETILTTGQEDPAAALALAARGSGPRYSDPRAALKALSIPVLATSFWRWPFAAHVDYLACATLTGQRAGLTQ